MEVELLDIKPGRGRFVHTSPHTFPPPHFPCSTRTCCPSTQPCSAGSRFSPHLSAPHTSHVPPGPAVQDPAMQRCMDVIKAGVLTLLPTPSRPLTSHAPPGPPVQVSGCATLDGRRQSGMRTRLRRCPQDSALCGGSGQAEALNKVVVIDAACNCQGRVHSVLPVNTVQSCFLLFSCQARG